MLSIIVSVAMTPVMIIFSKRINVVDIPNARSAHSVPMPTLGGLAIVVGFIAGLVIIRPESPYHLAIIVGAMIIVVVGFLDDVYNFTARAKLLFQLVAASVVVFWGGLRVDFINLPFGGELEFGWFSIAITLLWIVGITNAVNLIDGLDGLAAGVSVIALFTIVVMSVFMGNIYVLSIAAILMFSVLGFLPFNFFPAKIFMGDTGALFLGFMISVLALLGFKNVAVITFIVPVFILAVPILDTLVAIVRRLVKKQSIGAADHFHLHHRLINIGLSRRQTVLFIYLLSGMFSGAAILLSMSTLWGIVLISLVSLVVIQLLIETLELIDSKFKPLTKTLKKLRPKRQTKT